MLRCDPDVPSIVLLKFTDSLLVQKDNQSLHNKMVPLPAPLVPMANLVPSA
jgi:hypothetical protein